MIRCMLSTITPSFVLFATVGFYARPDFEKYLAIVRVHGAFSAAEKAFRVSKTSAIACAQALKDKGFVVNVAPDAKSILLPPAPPVVEYPQYEEDEGCASQDDESYANPQMGTLAYTARAMYQLGIMSGAAADAWKEAEYERRLNDI